MSVTFLRHASLPKKFQNRYIGRSDIGIDERLFDFEKVKELIECEYDLAYASSLKRTQQTLQMMGKNFIVDSRLDEVEFRDDIEGKSFEEIEKLERFDSRYLENFESWFEFVCKESMKSLKKRVLQFLNELPEDKEVIVCTHGGILMEIFGKKIDYLDKIKCDWDKIKIKIKSELK